MSTVIKVEHLSKRYRLGQLSGRTLTEDLNRWWARLRHKPDPYLKIGHASLPSTLSSSKGNPQSEGGPPVPGPRSPVDYLWALKDVSFNVEQGEVLGIIGRNGAGKSTLLKILSRITAPTSGEVKIKGRVASLLEVGTGFHPDLTGRENVYLNGSILGMTRKEVERKFDEIVAFAEIEQFIDTPVKRYSSGMYVRLAFAVAAHLEPEILLVDEVLAVGDAGFQKRCIGKMGEVAKGGRTVLFVSHNMQAIQSLCRRVVRIDCGRIAEWGDPRSVVSAYLSSLSVRGNEKSWPLEEAPGNEEFKLLTLHILSSTASEGSLFSSKDDLLVQLLFTASTKHPALCVGFDVMNAAGEPVLRTYQTDQDPERWPEIRLGRNLWECVIPAGLLNAGVYLISPRVGLHNMYWIINSEPVLQFELTLDHGVSPLWNSLDGRFRPGCIAPILDWQAVPTG